jgi:hypothetical protein
VNDKVSRLYDSNPCDYLITGYQSYVGQLLHTYPEQWLIDVKYRYSNSGHGKNLSVDKLIVWHVFSHNVKRHKYQKYHCVICSKTLQDLLRSKGIALRRDADSTSVRPTSGTQDSWLVQLYRISWCKNWLNLRSVLIFLLSTRLTFVCLIILGHVYGPSSTVPCQVQADRLHLRRHARRMFLARAAHKGVSFRKTYMSYIFVLACEANILYYLF